MIQPTIIRSLTAEQAMGCIPALAEILIDCVEGGASVSFMTPLSREKARSYWNGVAEGVAAGDRVLLVAEDPDGRDLVGTVQLVLGLPENQPHRADVAKMLVRRAARNRGLGSALMRAAEAEARSAGRTVLMLDTVPGTAAERLYDRLGWRRVGRIPGYALMPDGAPCDTMIFYKSLVTT